MIFKNSNVYDVLKYIALIGLPAISALYAGLAETWGLPYGEQIVITINLVAVFLGTLLQVSSAKYNKKIQSETSEEVHE